jgi:hypothetical protein
MTRKDYTKAAELVRTSSLSLLPAARKVAVDILVELFQSDNPRFDETKFRAACSP